MKRLVPLAIATLLTITACNSSEADTPDPVGIVVSCGDDIETFERTTRFASPREAWELSPEERVYCEGFWVGAASQHEYTPLEREALGAANIQEAFLPDLYGRCAAANLGFYSSDIWKMYENPEFWENSSPLEQLRGALVLCPDHPDQETVQEQSAQAAEAEKQREQGE